MVVPLTLHVDTGGLDEDFTHSTDKHVTRGVNAPATLHSIQRVFLLLLCHRSAFDFAA